jgi:hypothetical protein
MLGLLKTIWRRWKALAHGIIAVQNWVLMAVAYGVGLGPVAVVMRLTGAELLDGGQAGESDSHWLPITADPEDISRAQRPW